MRQDTIAGRLDRDFVAFSNASPTRSTIASWNGLPTICTLTGKPARPETRADAHRRIARDVERHGEVGLVEKIPFRDRIHPRRLARRAGGDHHVQFPHRGLQFRAQLAPAPHRLHVIDTRHQRAEMQSPLHALGEIAEPRARPFFIGARRVR